MALLATVPGIGAAQWKTDFENHVVPLEEITSGGPPKDGIPPIDHPVFVSPAEADDWLDDVEPVVVMSLAGEARAYPLQILIWHEIVNDDLGGQPVSITYCPLCNTAIAFDRRFDGTVLDFGTTGMLRHSDLVMYDRQTETWWQQATGEGLVGTYAGRHLTFLSAPLVSWKAFKAEYPDGVVLSRSTGFSRAYGRNPYRGYDSRDEPFGRFFRAQPDGRIGAMDRVVAVTIGEVSVAYPLASLASDTVIEDSVGQRPIVVFWAPGTSSALDTDAIAAGRDIGATGVFDRTVEGRALTFQGAAPGRFVDTETQSTWNVFGRALAGPLAGHALIPIPHHNPFWFAWAVFRPDTRIGPS
jgi:hypothetical protein